MPSTIETSQQRQLARRKRSAGMTLMEIMIVIIILAMIGTGVAVAVLPQLKKAQIKSTQTDAQALRSAVVLYVADHPRECPAVSDLVSEGILDSSKRTTDAWDTEFAIACEDGEIEIVSAGEDLEFNTEDDIR